MIGLQKDHSVRKNSHRIQRFLVYSVGFLQSMQRWGCISLWVWLGSQEWLNSDEVVWKNPGVPVRYRREGRGQHWTGFINLGRPSEPTIKSMWTATLEGAEKGPRLRIRSTWLSLWRNTKKFISSSCWASATLKWAVMKSLFLVTVRFLIPFIFSHSSTAEKASWWGAISLVNSSIVQYSP